jgi:hypothetical protein
VLNLPDDQRQDLSDDVVARLIARGQPVAGIDFGAWRFAFVLGDP